MLDLLRKLFFDIFLESPEQERSQNRLELFNDRHVKSFVVVDCLVEWIREPFFEVLLVGEDVRHEEMHERPEFHNIFLKRCSC